MKPDVAGAESEIDWSAIDWLRRSVVVRGKTGERELPLSRKMIRTLQFLFLRRSSAPWTGCRSQILSAGVLYCLFKQAAARVGRPGSPASPASSSTTDKALQLSARNKSSACALFCRSIESIESSILLPSVARGKKTPSHGEVNSGGRSLIVILK